MRARQSRLNSSPVTAGALPPLVAAIAERDAIVRGCAILHPSGAHLSDGLAVLIERDAATEVRVIELTAPGALLSAYVNRGVRRFLLALDGVAPRPADLIDTTWQPTGRRLCRFVFTGD